MIFDGVPFTQYANNIKRLRYIVPFVHFLEKKLGVRVLYKQRNNISNSVELADASYLAEILLNKGVLRTVHRVYSFPDEPPYHEWAALCGGELNHYASGAAIDDKAAL